MKNTRIGSTFESFLEEQGFKDEVDLLAQKRVIAWQIEQAMAEGKITKAEMAARMKTSRTQIERLLDPQNNKVQLDTLQRAAVAVGRSLKVELVRTTGAGRRHKAIVSARRHGAEKVTGRGKRVPDGRSKAARRKAARK